MNLIVNKYKIELSKILNCNPQNLFLYWKGRVALYAALKAIGIKENDEIILPAFTCVVVPNAILYLKAKPVYVEIDPENYNTNFENIEKAITKSTKVIIIQNTFGLSSQVDRIVVLARQNNLVTIEDCTHGFGGFYNGKPNGSYCDFAFYSTQWNKPFSTGLGGILQINNEKYYQKIKQLEKEKIKPSLFEKFILKSLILFNKLFINERTHWMLVKFYRLLSNYNLIIGSNQGSELNSLSMPNDYCKDISSVQVNEGLKSLKKFHLINANRKRNAREYSKFLNSKNKKFVHEKLFDNHLFLKYPVLTNDRKKFLELAEKEKIILGDWFLSPLHPIKGNLKIWGFNCTNFPIATSIASKIVNLPTDINDNSKVLRFLSNHLDLIE
ncbi:MAG TPA: hypothetical protein DHV28_18535 [Ignavibacteriales bacterium]|nr:hypothetical protein [Ignavibacteriales bacterium]